MVTIFLLTLSVRHGGVALPARFGESERVLGGHAEHVGGEGLQAGHVVRRRVVLRLHGAAPRARRLALPESEANGVNGSNLLELTCVFIQLNCEEAQKDLRGHQAAQPSRMYCVPRMPETSVALPSVHTLSSTA